MPIDNVISLPYFNKVILNQKESTIFFSNSIVNKACVIVEYGVCP